MLQDIVLGDNVIFSHEIEVTLALVVQFKLQPIYSIPNFGIFCEPTKGCVLKVVVYVVIPAFLPSSFIAQVCNVINSCTYHYSTVFIDFSVQV